MHFRLFSCVSAHVHSLCQLCILEFRLGMASFSVLHSFLLVSLMSVCSFVCPIHSALSFHTLVPCCSAAESFALDLRHIRIRIIFCWTCCSASNRRTTHLFSTIVVIKVGGRLFCLFGLLRLLFTRVLENFIPLMLLYFSIQIIAYLLLLAIQSSHFFAIVTVALLSLVLVYPLLLSALSDLVSFAVVSLTKLVLLLLLLHSNCVPQLGILLLCVLCLAICLCASQSRRNAQLNWLTFVWTPACCRC